MLRRICITILAAALSLCLIPCSAIAESYWDDPNPPTLSSIAVDRAVASVGDTVRISWDIQDADGVESVMPYMTSQDPSHKDPSSASSWGIGSTEDTTTGFNYNIRSTDSPGKRWIVGLEVYDKAGYVTNIWDSTYKTSVEEGDLLADMSAAVFEIIDPASIPTYSVLEGNSSVYMPGSNAGLTFRFDGPLEKFMHLEIDGTVIPSLHYALREGSTIVTLNPAYLDQMKAGAHTITAHYTDGGRAVAVFGIQPKSSEKKDDDSSESEESTPPQPNDRSTGGLPQTGDTTPLLLLFGICFVALAMMATSFFGMKEARQSR